MHETDDQQQTRPPLAMRAFPWIVLALSVVAVASAISLLPEASLRELAVTEAEGRGETAVAAPQGLAAPQSPYAHLQDEIVPRDFRTIHEGGPVGLYAIDAKQDKAAFCDESHWRGDSFVKKVGTGQVFVDRDDWQNTPAGTRAQMASWMSKCTQAGHRVEIFGEGSGQLLATYHPREGLSILGD